MFSSSFSTGINASSEFQSQLGAALEARHRQVGDFFERRMSLGPHLPFTDSNPRLNLPQLHVSFSSEPAVVASLEASLKEKDEKLAGLEKNFATLQKRAKSRIQQLTQEKEAAEQQVGSGVLTSVYFGSDGFGREAGALVDNV